jgi:hypothetical protein
MGQVMNQDLGALIASENPYGEMTAIDLQSVTKGGIGRARDSINSFPAGNRNRTPADPEFWQGFFWTLNAGGGPPQTVRVSKVLRVPYTVAGQPYNLVVGFEGAGGP